MVGAIMHLLSTMDMKHGGVQEGMVWAAIIISRRFEKQLLAKYIHLCVNKSHGKV